MKQDDVDGAIAAFEASRVESSSSVVEKKLKEAKVCGAMGP